MRKKILFVGNMPTTHKNSIGGATVFTKEILAYLKTNAKTNNINFDHLVLRRIWISKLQILDYIYQFFNIIIKSFKYDKLSFHVSADFHFIFALIYLFVLKNILGKKIIYHSFGGVFHKRFEKLSSIRQKLVLNTIFKSEFVLLETLEQVNYFKEKGFSNVLWFPNARNKSEIHKKNYKYNKKIVFISRVSKEKGIDLLIQAASLLEKEGYTFTVYGPIDKTLSEDVFKNTNIDYKGPLESSQVTLKLLENDVLILPTIAKTEGYPGIIIEAMSVGVPIVATNINAMSDLVIDDSNGYLFKYNEISDLIYQLKKINISNYERLSKSSIKNFDNFDKNKVFIKLLKLYNHD